MNLVREESIDAVASSAVTEQLPERNDERRESQVSPQAAIHHLVTGRFAADIVGVAAELGLADQIQSGPKTAEEIAAAMGLHAPSLYRLLRALANFGIFAEQEDGNSLLTVKAKQITPVHAERVADRTAAVGLSSSRFGSPAADECRAETREPLVSIPPPKRHGYAISIFSPLPVVA